MPTFGRLVRNIAHTERRASCLTSNNFPFIAAPLVAVFFVLFCSSYIKNAFATAGRVLGRKRREDMVMRYERDEKNRLYRRD